MSPSRHIKRTARRRNALVPSGTRKALPQVYLKDGDKIFPEIYMTDHGTHKGAMVKWIFSTMFAGIVGVGAIGTVIYASLNSDKDTPSGSLTTQLRQIGAKAMTPFKPLRVKRHTGPRPIGMKGDRLTITSKGLSTRHIIQDTYSKKRDNRDYLIIKPYALTISSLATASPANRSVIPPFDPFKLYANTAPINSLNKGKTIPATNGATTKSFSLPLFIAPADEQYQMTDILVEKLVEIAAEDYLPKPQLPKTHQTDDMVTGDGGESAANQLHPKNKNTTIVAKTPLAPTAIADETMLHEKTIRQGDSMNSLLRSAGAENWQSVQITAAMNKIYPIASLKIGQKLRYISVPKPGDVGKSEPVEISLYSGKTHLVSVSRDEAGDYVASAKPGQIKYVGRSTSYPRRTTLYESFYHAGLSQKLAPEIIMKLLRIHAFDTNFKRATQPGDSFEAFFDMREDKENFENIPNELLFTSIIVDGEKHAFYRFRTPNGVIDYYDRGGNSAKKFLMRKPVRSNRIRLASGFGWRMHPILHRRKMHTGTDWAGPPGTPILAAGDGIIEKASRKGSYGNHIRIRHANGYKTTYSHMRGYAKGMKPGIKVRQGQVIGYIGTTGRSTGPHLHFEVLVNNKFVNAMTIPVPRGLELKGHLLSKFVKERDRIDELMARDPVTTKVASVK